MMDLERSTADHDGTDAAREARGRVVRLALDMSAHQTRHVLETGALESSYGAELLGLLEDAIRDSLASGASMDEVARLTHGSVDPLCRARAGGLLRSKAAVLAYVEEHLLEDSQGEVSVAEVARLRGILQTARDAMEEAVRRGVATGMAVDDVVGVAQECGVGMSREEVVLAFHQRRR
jgi:bacterioferritin-associated ferredoxin